MLAYDLDRHTPFKPEEVYFDAAIVGRDPAQEGRCASTGPRRSRRVVDRRGGERRAGARRWSPSRPIARRRRGSAARTTLNLLPPAERPDAAAGRGWEIWVPLALLVASPRCSPPRCRCGRSAATRSRCSSRPTQARAQADASNALREQLERLTGDYNFALSKKYAFPSALQSVEDVTKLLPDDTWLTQLEVKNTAKGKEPKREIVVRGESVNAGRLISLFEDSKLFSEAAPRSPTTKIQPGPGEIFDLGAQLKPLPPPPPVQLATLQRRSAPSAAPSSLRRRPLRPHPRPPLRLHGSCGRARATPGRTCRRAAHARHVAPPTPAAAAPGTRSRLRAAPAVAPAHTGRASRRRPPVAGARAARSPPHRRRKTDDRGDRQASAAQQRALAVALLVVAVVLALAVLLVPLLLLHKHYDDTIAELTDRLERYRRIAAQAPEYRKALDAMREKDGRRFFLKNSAPNLAGAELQEQVRTAIESNGGRITTSQNQGPKDEGRFRQITVTVQFFASIARAAEDPVRTGGAAALSVGREHDAAAAQRVSRLQAGARAGAGDQRSTRRRTGFAFAEPERK